MMPDKKRKRGRPRVAPVLSYGSELKLRNNITRNIKKPRYLRDQDEEDSISRGSTPARSLDNVSLHSKSSANGKSRNGRGYNPEIDDKDSEYHYGSDFDMEEDSDIDKYNQAPDSRSISEATSDLEESDLGDLNIDEGESLIPGSETAPNFVPFWKLGPAGTLGHRPQTPIPVWLQDRKFPPLDLPSSSDDLLMPLPYVLQAVGIYEVLRHFRNIARLSPFHFEDFCTCLLTEELSILLSEIHISLIKALIREEEIQQTHYGQLDQKDSINIALYFVDPMTWPETLRVYLQSDSKEFKSTLAILDSCSYPHTTLENRLAVLQFLCDQFLQTTPAREDLLSEGKIRYDDHCRACHKTGDLLCCDSCPAVYHLDCADPPLSNVPLEIEDWTCTLCNKHKLEGVTDCSSIMEASGMMSRQEPIGYDRHGRKYWFLVRRIIVESEEGNIWYYSTLEQLDLLMLLLDSEDLEEVLYVALKEFGDDIRRQMEITEKITDKARGSRKAAITVEMEETRKEIEKIQTKKENAKKKDTEELKDIIEEVKTEEEKTPAESDVKAEVKEEGVEEHDVKKAESELKEPSKIDSQPNIKETLQIKKEKVYSEEEIAEMIETKMEQLRMPKGMLYRLGCDLGCRTYVNNFVNNTLALNKLQHNEERDKKRHLSHKFSLTSNSDFKWQGQCYGSSDNQMANVRQTILSLEQNISTHFFHPNWQYFRKVWIQYVGSATKACQFGKALLWLVACIKPVVFTTVWHESLGHIRLKRITVLDREERKKQEKRERREAEDESKLFPLVKFTKGVKHQLWKTKGEEYRIHGLWGWRWLSANRKVSHVPMSTVGLRAGPEKITIPIKSNGEGGGLIRGLPISATSYYQLAAKTPALKFSLLSPNQKREEEESKSEGEKKKKEIMLANAGQFEVSPIDLENYFEDGVINVSNELNSRLRLVYPKLTKGSSFLDGFLPRRLTLKIQEERDLAKNKKSQKDKKESENDHHVDVENDSESSASDDNNNNNNNNDGVDEDETVEENIEEIPDSQRRVTIHKRRPAGHLLKEMRMHKFKYEALDKMDEMYPCYSPSCRNGRRSSCYSPSCIIKMKTKQKLVNSVSNYKIITSKPAPFDNIGSCSPVRLNEENEADSGKKSETAYNSQSLSKTMASNGQITQLPASVEDKEKSFSKLPLDEDSSHSQGSYSSDQKTNCKGEKVFSSENTSGKIYLKKSTEIKKQKKHKIPPINYFRVMKLWKKEEDNSKPQINKRSLFILPSWELSIMARKGGKYCPNGFNLNAKVNHHFWPYPCPRPVFKITWLYRTTLVNSINAVAYQLRVLWTCLKWDEMHEKGPADGRKQITTDIEIIQTEILKRKITGRFLEKTNYLRRKVVIPLDVPKPVREFTPSQRSGLRKRRRAQSPINQQPQSSEEWVEEDKVDLWEIKFFGERLEKAATLSKKSEKGDSSFSAISRSTSPAEFKARMEEQLKIQRANFNQKKSIENQSNASSNKGIVKVAIGSAVTGNGSGSKLTFTNSGRLIQTPSIVTMGSKLPSVLAGKKIVTTKGGKIITVQTSGGGLTLGSQQSDNSKLSVNKSSIFPVSSLPKVQVTPQGNKVIKLQNMNTCGQRTILPRVVSSQNNSQTSIIRPFTTSTSTSQNFQPIATSTPVSGVRPVVASQQIQIFRMPDGQFQVKGLQEGQQLLQRGDGKLQVVNTKIAGSPVTSNVSSNSIQVTQQTKPLSVTGKDTQVRGIAPLSGNQILRINGQQVILRTSSTAPNGKSVTSISAKDTSLAGGNVSIPKFKPLEEQNPKVSPIGQNQINSNSLLKTQSANSSPLLKNQPATNVSEEKSKMSLSSTPPSSPTKGAASTTPGVTNTMTLRVQVRMTEQGPKTIIQGLQPGVGLTKDHIMAIQQQVRSMLAQYNLQVNQLSPLMTLTLQSTNKSQQQSSKAGNTVQQTSLPSPTPVNSLLKSAISSETSTIPEKEKAVDILGVKDLTSDLKENSQTIQTALNKNDLTPDVEEKLLQLQKLTKTKKSPQDGTPSGRGSKRLREDEGEWDTSDVTPSKAKSNKRAKSEKKLKKDGLSSTSPISAVTSPTSATPVVAVANTYAGSKTIHQDARKKLARQQRLEAMLGKHKDLLKKDILKKRALLEKELQLQIHKELSLARQQLHTFEKLKNVESVSSPPAKKPKQDPVATPVSHNVTPSKEIIKTKKGEPHPPTIMSTSGSSTLKINPKTSAASRVNKKSNKTKSKKIVCICRTFFDDTKFYVGCDLCGNWFHGDCVGITETLSRSMTEYVCDDCANAKLNKDLFCFCRQPYDETQFYICCEKCEDWYHGKCIGIMQAEADDIDDYICPKCEPDNKWNRPCQKKLTDKDYTELKKVAKLLIQHKNAWPFLEPVDQSEVPDYYKVVKQPMDLKAVERKVQQRKYKNLFEFVGDVMLVFDNCRAYNPPNSSFFSCANNLEGFFCMKLKQLKSKIGQKS